MKTKSFSITATVVALVVMGAFASCGKESEKEYVGVGLNVVTYVAKTYPGEYPFPEATSYEYDALGRLVAKNDTVDKGQASESAVRYVYTYEDNLVRCTAPDFEIRWELEDGRAVRETTTRYGTSSTTRLEYDDDGYLVREYFASGDTGFYTWKDGNLIRYTKTVRVADKVKTLVDEYSYSQYDMSVYPMTPFLQGLREMAAMGFYGKLSKNLPDGLTTTITDEDTITYYDKYAYEVEDGRAVRAEVDCDFVPYTVTMDWDIIVLDK